MPKRKYLTDGMTQGQIDAVFCRLTQRPTHEIRPCKCGCFHEGKGMDYCTCLNSEHKYDPVDDTNKTLEQLNKEFEDITGNKMY